MNVQQINVEKFPLIILTDTHTNLEYLHRIQGLYPFNQKICLGDITSLWSKAESFNENSIQYFIKNKIPCLKGNHEEHIASCQRGGEQYIFRAIPSFGEYDISKESLDFICKLPIAFKLNLPNKFHYLCFHNRPDDLWSFTERHTFNEEEFKECYNLNDKTLGVLIGHQHEEFIQEYKSSKLICVNKLSKIGAYALLDENGVHFKQL